MPNITKTFVDNLQPGERDQIFWDDKLTGFGIKVTPKGRKVYIFKYRNAVRQQRKPAIGVHGIITCMQARDIAHSWALSLKNGIVNLPHFSGQFVKTVFIHFLKHGRRLKIVS